LVIQETLTVKTPGRGTTAVTDEVNSIVQRSGVRRGLCNVFVQHTSASLILSENADPDVLSDLETFMSRTVVDGDPLYRHTAEGPDDMSAHIRSVLTQTGFSLPVGDGRCLLGIWQGIFLWEHRHMPHSRRIIVTVCGD